MRMTGSPAGENRLWPDRFDAEALRRVIEPPILETQVPISVRENPHWRRGRSVHVILEQGLRVRARLAQW
jgi:hypothetical protein